LKTTPTLLGLVYEIREEFAFQERCGNAIRIGQQDIGNQRRLVIKLSRMSLIFLNAIELNIFKFDVYSLYLTLDDA
jgi:hypothetical protein